MVDALVYKLVKDGIQPFTSTEPRASRPVTEWNDRSRTSPAPPLPREEL
jgi:hypothetical protein